MVRTVFSELKNCPNLVGNGVIKVWLSSSICFMENFMYTQVLAFIVLFGGLIYLAAKFSVVADLLIGIVSGVIAALIYSLFSQFLKRVSTSVFSSFLQSTMTLEKGISAFISDFRRSIEPVFMDLHVENVGSRESYFPQGKRLIIYVKYTWILCVVASNTVILLILKRIK